MLLRLDDERDRIQSIGPSTWHGLKYLKTQGNVDDGREGAMVIQKERRQKGQRDKWPARELASRANRSDKNKARKPAPSHKSGRKWPETCLVDGL